MRVIGSTSIRKILDKKLKENGYSFSQLALKLGKDVRYLQSVLKGRTISRPTVYRIAKLLNFPELCYLYEEMLEQRRVERKKKVSTKEGDGK